MNGKYSDTIAAISTALGSSGIGIVRKKHLTLQIKYMLEKRISGLQNRSLIQFITDISRMRAGPSMRFW